MRVGSNLQHEPPRRPCLAVMCLVLGHGLCLLENDLASLDGQWPQAGPVCCLWPCPSCMSTVKGTTGVLCSCGSCPQGLPLIPVGESSSAEAPCAPVTNVSPGAQAGVIVPSQIGVQPQTRISDLPTFFFWESRLRHSEPLRRAPSVAAQRFRRKLRRPFVAGDQFIRTWLARHSASHFHSKAAF